MKPKQPSASKPRSAPSFSRNRQLGKFRLRSRAFSTMVAEMPSQRACQPSDAATEIQCRGRIIERQPKRLHIIEDRLDLPFTGREEFLFVPFAAILCRVRTDGPERIGLRQLFPVLLQSLERRHEQSTLHGILRISFCAMSCIVYPTYAAAIPEAKPVGAGIGCAHLWHHRPQVPQPLVYALQIPRTQTRALPIL